ncbi:MAG: flagellar basal body P-ring protein FlgI [Fuerstiella sp.]
MNKNFPRIRARNTSVPGRRWPGRTVLGRTVLGRTWLGLLLTILLVGVSGCASSLLNLSGANALGSKFASLVNRDKDEPKGKEEDHDFDTETRIETPLLRDYISVTGNNLVALRGVGLVTQLDGTGGDPPPSHLRKELLDEMARLKIPNPSRILASRNTALVIVTAYLPAMVREGQTFDVRVALPPNSEATSLKGGVLLETRLTEEHSVPGRGNLKGHQYGVAGGAILTALGDGGRSNGSMLRRGSIPGGAVSKTERNLEVILRNEYRGLKTAKRIENAIARRLHHYNRFGQRVPMAEAKTDMMIELKVHPTYRNNFPRYNQVIRSIAYKETDVARRLRMERLSRDILEPETAGSAALQLEAIGNDSVPFLQAALSSPSLEVRFHAAQALAYLEDSSGVDVLKQAAIEEPAFRVYALAALSVIDDADSVVALRELMSAEQLETRYGAIRALKENNPNDSILGTTEFPGQFLLHAVNTDGAPAAHVVRYRSPEVVIFGTGQKLRLPAVLNAGTRIRVIGKAGENTVTVTKYELGADSERRVVSTSLVEILHTVADLGARYPDVVQLLLEADEQANLMGELGIDRLPQAGRSFRRSGSGPDSSEAKLGTPALTPGLFDQVEDSDRDTSEEAASALARMFSLRDSAENEDATARDADAEHTDNAAGSTAGTGENETATDASTEDASSDTSDTSDMLDATDIQNLDLSEEAAQTGSDADDGDDFVLEKTDFREPLGSRMRRIFLSPFQSSD